MVPSLTEIILLIVIVVCIFGLGKLGDISEALGELRAKRARGLPPKDAVDITPDNQRRVASGSVEPRPGTREQPVDEAVVEPDDTQTDEEINRKPDNDSEA